MAEETFKKEVDYRGNINDFRGDCEIMVTITLHEYRELVEKNAKHAEELRKAELKYCEEYKKACALREKLDKLLETVNDGENDGEIY